jgi:hypothetical protein
MAKTLIELMASKFSNNIHPDKYHDPSGDEKQMCVFCITNWLKQFKGLGN